jgi:hypothetical protein
MAYNFDAASSQFLSIPNNSILVITGNLTVMAWVKRLTAPVGTNAGIVSKFVGTGSQRGYTLYQNPTNKAGGGISSDGVNFINILSTTSLTTDWTHVAFTYTPSSSIIIYVNGIQDGIKTTSIPASIFSSSAELLIGSIARSVNQNFGGSISEAAVYNTTLSASEIASAAKGFTPDQIRPHSLVFYAPLVRNLIDLKGGLPITNNNSATVVEHPRIIS